MTPPVALIRKLGLEKAHTLAATFADNATGFKGLEWLPAMAKRGAIDEVKVVHREDHDGVAVVKIRRPKVLNALNEDAFAQLRSTFEAIDKDPSVKASVLTGFGVKAFVSGADVHFLARIDSPETGMEGSRDAQALTAFIESMQKPVVCALNGVTFGGGLEIAMACTARICRKKMKVLAGQPEVNLGIIPGAGGTQRLPRWIGIDKASQYLRTGRPFSSESAVKTGLCLEEADLADLVPRACELARGIADGTQKVPSMPKGPLENVPTKLPDADIGHLSKKIDEILCQTILDGARGSITDGLALENRMFGEICKTDDMKIGIKTFLEKGPRAKAEFQHS